MKRWPCLVLTVAAFAGCSGGTPGPASKPGPMNDPLDHHFQMVRTEFSGARALETVAFMEGRFRLPGNSGFDASIGHVVGILRSAGYVEEGHPHDGNGLTYRLEERPMEAPTWEPVAGSLDLVGPEGERLMDLEGNLNMIGINSYSTPTGGLEGDLVCVGEAALQGLPEMDLEGKIVFAESGLRSLFRSAVQEGGAAGVLSYTMPSFNRPEENPHSVQFSSIPLDPEQQSWGLRLSHSVKERLWRACESGPVRVRVTLETRIYQAEELTLVANVRGKTYPEERFVLSAHVQEPGANDNASGVAVQAEIARVLGEMVEAGRFSPDRSISMIWGDEISSTRRYVEDDTVRAEGILWGVSLDMVGEDTDRTGGSFLIEKMPDPSTIWTRGDERHTEWWGDGRSPLSVEDLTPHYLNDFILNRCLDQAAVTGWVVKTNPFEGGSDHVPFLRAGIPGLLLWHFTDQFYHTDGDRIDKVSQETMENVGVATTVSAMTLTSAEGAVARKVIREVEAAALDRLATEFELSRQAIAAGEDAETQILILRSWLDWYRDALRTTRDIQIGGSSRETVDLIEAAMANVTETGEGYLEALSAS